MILFVVEVREDKSVQQAICQVYCNTCKAKYGLKDVMEKVLGASMLLVELHDAVEVLAFADTSCRTCMVST